MLLVTWCPTKLHFQATLIFRDRKIYTFSNTLRLSNNFCLTKIKFAQKQDIFRYYQGVFRKEKTKGYQNKNKKHVFNVDWGFFG